MSDDRTPLVVGLAYVACLALLWDVAPAGELPLGGAALALVFAAWPEPQRRNEPAVLGWGRVRRRWGLPAILSVVVAASAGAASLIRLMLEPDALTVVAWSARILCLGGVATVVRTPPAALSLHGLVVLLGTWTAAAVTLGPEPPRRTQALVLVTLVALAIALLRARSYELGRAAASSYTIGVAPTPWGARRSRSPILAVTLLALLPWALGVELPRVLPTPASTGAARAGRAADPTARIEFSSSLRVDQERSGVESPRTVVARVRATPDAPELLLRGAVLERATAAGFFPADAAPRDPRPRTATPRRLEVELLRPQEGYLLLTGPLTALEGAEVEATPAGPRLVGTVAYPLRYRADCLEPAGTYTRDDLLALDRPEALALPAAVRTDPTLRALADEVAWGRTPVARARHAQAWLRARCSYDLSHRVTAGDLATRVRRFLNEETRGICLEFSAALTVLLRLVDVPARIATGYRADERDPSGAFVVRSAHAHAWVEVGLQGAGWVPFDPTPPLSEAALPDGVESPLEGPPPAPPEPEPPFGLALPSGRLLGTLFALATLALAAGGATTSYRLRREVQRGQLARDSVSTPALIDERARLFAALARRGFELDGSETPLEFLERLREAGSDEPALDQAVALYTRLRFSGRAEPGEREALRRLVRRL